MPTLPTPTPYQVALLGFSDFERDALASCFRLAHHRAVHYVQVQALAESDFVVADADHTVSVQRVLAAGCIDQTVFIGSQAPAGASAWMRRPIDPLHVMRELDAMAALATLAAPQPGPPLPSPPPLLSALLVDDSELALRFLQTRLQRWGVRSACVSTSGKAIELLSRRGFDFVFLDVELGSASDLDGLALCQHIKRQYHPARGRPAASVVMVSAHHSELDRVRGTLAGCDAYLGKPLEERDLARLLRRHGLQAPAPKNAGSGA